ncbi:hypothetical protein [Vreelandella alkaliphila]|uniref:hypothetical protein n=1 Tax=Vreelandella alkaliphila TaxID=272774 RepID=UPI003FD8D571
MTDLQQQLQTLADRMTTDQAVRGAEITTLVQRIEQLERRVQHDGAQPEAAPHLPSMSDASIDALKVRSSSSA